MSGKWVQMKVWVPEDDCTIEEYTPSNTAEREANGRLVTAAPELLEALKVMREELEQITGYWTERLDTAAQMADAALKKAGVL